MHVNCLRPEPRWWSRLGRRIERPGRGAGRVGPARLRSWGHGVSVALPGVRRFLPLSLRLEEVALFSMHSGRVQWRVVWRVRWRGPAAGAPGRSAMAMGRAERSPGREAQILPAHATLLVILRTQVCKLTIGLPLQHVGSR